MKPLPVIIAAGGLVFNDRQELLMIFRRGKWDLPKGKLDEGESIEQCALREVREETGLSQLALGKTLGVTYHEYFDKYLDQDVRKESHWFTMNAAPGQETLPQAEEDIQAITWVKDESLRQCLQNSYPNIIDIIQRAGLLPADGDKSVN